MLYTINFTTKKLIKKYDSKGKIVGESEMNTPITMNDLPYDTAMSYKREDNNFIMSACLPDDKRKTRSVSGVGNATRRVDREVYSRGAETTPRVSTPKTPIMSGSQRAAATGNLSGAING